LKAEVLVGEEAPPLPITTPPSDSAGPAAARTFTIVSFWASWCLPCRAEMPVLSRFVDSWNEEHSSLGVRVQYVAVNTGENQDRVAAVVDDPRYASVIFAFDEDGSFAEAWGVEGLPATYLLSPSRRIVDMISGYEENIAARLRGELRSQLSGLDLSTN
jgi:thiol-disulfide isomerase/thioredoxin